MSCVNFLLAILLDRLPYFTTRITSRRIKNAFNRTDVLSPFDSAIFAANPNKPFLKPLLLVRRFTLVMGLQ